MGRSTKATPEITAAIAAAVEVGVPLRQACERVGVSHKTALEWIRRGQGRDGRPARKAFAAFAEAHARARARDVTRRVARLNQAAEGKVLVFSRTYTQPNGT